jgi:hypothetical protein
LVRQILSPCTLKNGKCVKPSSTSNSGGTSSTNNNGGSAVNTETPSTTNIPTSSITPTNPTGETGVQPGDTGTSPSSDEENDQTKDSNSASINQGKSTVGSTMLSIVEAGVVAFGLSEGVKYLISVVFPSMSTENTEGFGAAVGWGYFAGQAVAEILQACGVNLGALGGSIGIPGLATVGVAGIVIAAVAAIVYLLFGYKESKIYQVTFMCYPWQPSNGGDNCEKCNEPLFGTDEIRCSKYRCESLGASCELINEGTEDELCYYVDRNDVNPPEISAWSGALKDGFSFPPLLQHYLEILG